MSDHYFGTKAHLLPGAEILNQFNIHENTVSDSTHVATIPGRDDCLLRWLTTSEKNPRVLDNILETAKTHFGKLVEVSDATVQIPSHRSFVAPMPGQWAQVAMFSTVEKIGGEAIKKPKDPRGALGALSTAKYLDWIWQSRQDKVLADLWKP